MVNQRHACSSPSERNAEHAPRQDDTHAVRRCQVNSVEQTTKSRVTSGLHNKLRVDSANLVQSSRPHLQKALYSPDCPFFVAIMYAHPEDIASAEPHLRIYYHLR